MRVPVTCTWRTVRSSSVGPQVPVIHWRTCAAGLENAGLSGLGVPGQGLVGPQVVEGVMPGPALLTEVLEAADTATEQGPRVSVARVTDAVLQVRLNLHLRL